MRGGSEFSLRSYCNHIVLILYSDWGGRTQRWDNDVALRAYIFISRFCCLPTRRGGMDKGEEIALHCYCKYDILYSTVFRFKKEKDASGHGICIACSFYLHCVFIVVLLEEEEGGEGSLLHILSAFELYACCISIEWKKDVRGEGIRLYAC